MSAGLYGSTGGANGQIKKLYAPVNGVNREIKELWAVKDGVNRKIFSAYDCQAIAYSPCVVSEDTSMSFTAYISNGDQILLFDLIFENQLSFNAGEELVHIASLHVSRAGLKLQLKASAEGAYIGSYPTSTNLPMGTNTNISIVSTSNITTNTLKFYVYNPSSNESPGTLSIPAQSMSVQGKPLQSFKVL